MALIPSSCGSGDDYGKILKGRYLTSGTIVAKASENFNGSQSYTIIYFTN